MRIWAFIMELGTPNTLPITIIIYEATGKAQKKSLISDLGTNLYCKECKDMQHGGNIKL